MAKVGRPQIEIPKKQFENLCALFCTLEEIATVLDCSSDTVERWCKREYGENFAEVFKKKSALGKTSLRRNAFKLAQTNTAMCIFLLKNYLGLKDTVEYEDKEAISRLDMILDSVKSEAEKDEAKSEAE